MQYIQRKAVNKLHSILSVVGEWMTFQGQLCGRDIVPVIQEETPNIAESSLPSIRNSYFEPEEARASDCYVIHDLGVKSGEFAVQST
jgi:hypothetical protein